MDTNTAFFILWLCIIVQQLVTQYSYEIKIFKESVVIFQANRNSSVKFFIKPKVFLNDETIKVMMTSSVLRCMTKYKLCRFDFFGITSEALPFFKGFIKKKIEQSKWLFTLSRFVRPCFRPWFCSFVNPSNLRISS